MPFRTYVHGFTKRKPKSILTCPFIGFGIIIMATGYRFWRYPPLQNSLLKHTPHAPLGNGLQITIFSMLCRLSNERAKSLIHFYYHNFLFKKTFSLKFHTRRIGKISSPTRLKNSIQQLELSLMTWCR